MRLRSLSLAIAGAIVLFCSANVLACSCAFGGSAPCQEFWRADAVFSGTVVSSGKISTGEGELKYEMRLVHLTVDQPIRGMRSSEVDVLTGWGGGDCGYGFKIGQPYLVYAYRDEKNNRLSTSICSRTRLMSEADEDFAFIRGLATSSANGLIYGNVGKRNYYWKEGESWQKPVADVPVTIEGGNSRYEARSDDKGDFRVTGVVPGKYMVKLTLPAGLVSPSGRDESDKTAEYEVEVVEHGCAEADFYLESDTRVSGRVLDAKGNPVANLNLNMRTTSNNKGGASNLLFGTTDQDGHFEFKTVAPGDYWLGYRIIGVPLQVEHPYGRTYFPGVPTRGMAAIVSVQEGKTISDLTLQMPPPLTPRTISGFVIWSDGKPAVGSSIYVNLNEEGDTSSLASVQTDAEGRFTLKLFEGLQYKISAYRESGGKQAQSEYIDVPLNPTDQPLRLVLPAQARN